MPVWYEIAGNAHARKSSNAARPWLSVRERASGRLKDAHGVVEVLETYEPIVHTVLESDGAICPSNLPYRMDNRLII